MASGLPVATTVMAVCAAGYLGQAAHARMTRGSYCRRLGLALSAVAGALGLL